MEKSEIKKKVFIMMNRQLSVGFGFGMRKDYDMVGLAYYRLVGMLDVLDNLDIITAEESRNYKKLILDLLYIENL